MKKTFELKTKNIHDDLEAVIRGDISIPEVSPGEKLPLLIIMHGFKGFKDWGFFPFICETLNSSGIATLRFNFSHNGVGEDLENFTELDKFKRNTFTQEISDLNLVFDYVIKDQDGFFSNIDKNRISLFGHSRGAYSVIVGGVDLPIHKAVSFAGIAGFPDVSREIERSGEVMESGW